MPEKFFDIVPPGQKKFVKKIKIEKEENLVENRELIPDTFEDQKTKDNFEMSQDILEKKRPRFKKTVIFTIFLGLFFVVLAGGFKYYKSSQNVEIKIWPKNGNVSLKEEVFVDDKKTQADFVNKIFPGKIITDQRSGFQEFSSTGKAVKEEKATGTIKVYNNYSASPQVLAAQTRFVSTEGKLFRSLVKITIPGQKYEKSKLTPGFVDAQVQAAESGPDYNIGPSTFSIPGFAGTSKYTVFYGKSSEAMKGGLKGEILQVSAGDIDKARDVLEQKLSKEGKEVLKGKVPADYVLLDQTISFEIVNESSSVSIGNFVDSFIFKEDVKLEGLAVKKSDIDTFVKNLLYSKVSNNEKVKEGSFKINYLLKSKENGKTSIVLDASVLTIPEIDINELKKAIAGKSFQEIKLLLGDNFQLAKIEIKTSNFLIKNVPEDFNKIKIDLSID